MANVKIKTAKKKDGDICVNLSKESRPTRRIDNELLWSKHIQECIKNKRGIIATQDKNIIGFAIRGQVRNKIHLQDIFVKEDFRRAWIGQKIFNKIEKIAQKQWFKEIISDCDIDNQTSINFHKKNGFTQTWVIKNHRDWIDSYTFVKNI